MKRNLLMIDDDRYSLDTTEEIIHTYMDNVNVFTALNGKEGIRLAKKHKMDVVLLDLNMPQMNGIEVCKILKDMDETKYTPVIFFTGTDVDSSVRSQALAVGGDEFISKPIQVVELVARINAMLRIKRMRDKIEEEKKIAEDNLSYMKMFWEFSSEMLKTDDLYELADKITRNGVSLTNASGGFINIYDNIEDKFVNLSLFKKDYKKEYTSSFEKLKFVGFTGLSSLIVNDVKSYCKKNKIDEAKLPFKNMIIIPIIAKKYIFGVLVLFDKEKGFDKEDVMRMETFSNFASGVLYNFYFSRKHLSLYEQRYESLFNLIDTPLFIVDDKGEFVDLNDAFARLFGCKNKYELDANNFFDLIEDKSDVLFIKRGLEVKDSIKGLQITLKVNKNEKLNVVLNVEKEGAVSEGKYYIKGSLSELLKMTEIERKGQLYKRINDFHTILDREFLNEPNRIYQNCAEIIRKVLGFDGVIIAVFNRYNKGYKTLGSSGLKVEDGRYDFSDDVLNKIKSGEKSIYKFQQNLWGTNNIVIPLKERKSKVVRGFISIIYNEDIKDKSTLMESIITFGNRLMSEIERYELEENIEFYSSLIDVLLNEHESPIVVIDKLYTIKYANYAFRKLIGTVDAEGKHCFKCVHNTDSPVDFCPIAKGFIGTTKKEEKYFEPFLNKNIIESIIPIIGTKGNWGYILEFRDDKK